MDIQDLLTRFSVSLGIGLLIGLERGWRTREHEPGSRAAGIRTFAISGLLGGVVGGLAQAAGAASIAGGLILGLGFAAYAIPFALFCREENRAEKIFSATTAIAGMLTFVLGAYALVGDMLVAAAAGVAAAVILALREDIHGFVAALTWPELRSALVLLTMTFIALPIVPNEPVGPFGGVNPRDVWLIAIVLAAVSFLGYAAVKYFGARRGILLASVAGGLVSSTAVTVTNARRAAAGEGAPQLLAAGVAVATAVSFLRVLAIVVALKPSLLALLAPPLIAATGFAAAYAAATAFWHSSRNSESQEMEFRNPFGFWQVVGFAALLAVVIVLGRALGQSFGAAGTIVGAAAIGVADVDAITVSVAQLVPGPLTVESATFAILAAVATNTASKLAIAGTIGRGRFALEVAAMSAGCAVAAAAVLWLVIAWAGA
jgi:uncharacterized membrane protein (DUF4010 family)